VAQQPVKGSLKPEVCIIELGGTIGDIEGMPFVEAFRQFQFRVKVEFISITTFFFFTFFLSVHNALIALLFIFLARKFLCCPCIVSANAESNRRSKNKTDTSIGS
jgi:hypothetical protein